MNLALDCLAILVAIVLTVRAGGYARGIKADNQARSHTEPRTREEIECMESARAMPVLIPPNWQTWFVVSIGRWHGLRSLQEVISGSGFSLYSVAK